MWDNHRNEKTFDKDYHGLGQVTDMEEPLVLVVSADGEFG